MEEFLFQTVWEKHFFWDDHERGREAGCSLCLFEVGGFHPATDRVSVKKTFGSQHGGSSRGGSRTQGSPRPRPQERGGSRFRSARGVLEGKQHQGIQHFFLVSSDMWCSDIHVGKAFVSILKQESEQGEYNISTGCLYEHCVPLFQSPTEGQSKMTMGTLC